MGHTWKLFNPSTVTTQDLTGLRLAGDHMGFSFPSGTKLVPGQFLVIAQNRTAFHATYGTAIPALGDWIGTLDRTDKHVGIYNDDGQGHTNVFNQLAFEAALPWSTDADNGGASLQLINCDERQHPTWQLDRRERHWYKCNSAMATRGGDRNCEQLDFVFIPGNCRRCLPR